MTATSSTHGGRAQTTRWPARVLLVLDRPALAEMVKLTLNHGVYSTRTVSTPGAVSTSVAEWQPHLIVLDLDLQGQEIIALLTDGHTGGVSLPLIGLTRRGDLGTKLAAFEAGVDDILTIPFAPEELLARVIAVLRRSYRDVATFSPVIKIGDLQIRSTFSSAACRWVIPSCT